MFCPRCGTELQHDDEYCRKCGRKVDKDLKDVDFEPAKTTKEHKEKDSNKKEKEEKISNEKIETNPEEKEEKIDDKDLPWELRGAEDDKDGIIDEKASTKETLVALGAALFIILLFVVTGKIINKSYESKENISLNDTSNLTTNTSNSISESDIKSIIELKVQSWLVSEIGSNYSSYDAGNSRYDIGKIEKNSDSKYTAYGTVSLYDKYGSYQTTKNFTIHFDVYGSSISVSSGNLSSRY